jgi:hypothetical protein
MGLFRRSKHTAGASRKPTLRERRAAERTARAEASLVETEQKIHQIADEARSDLKGSARLSREPKVMMSAAPTPYRRENGRGYRP